MKRNVKQSMLVLISLALCSVEAVLGQASYSLDYSTFLGGGDTDRAQYSYVDGDGYLYIAGNSQSSDFPTTPGAFDRTSNGGQDAIVAKFDRDGKTLIWSTYIGGSLRDQAYAVRVDAARNVYVVGATGSSDFPTTPGAYDRQFNGGTQGAGGYGDAFALKLSADGSTLIYSTFIGGAGGAEENPRAAMHVDAAGNLYMGGYTQSMSFPTTAGAFQPTFGGGFGDGFLVKLSADGSTLLHSTYLGGSDDDLILEEIAGLPDGSLIVSGATTSANFPTTPGAYQTGFNGPGGAHFYDGADGFVTRISGDLSSLVYSTYLGGTRHDDLGGVIVDSDGRALVLGNIFSPDMPVTTGAYQPNLAGERDGYLVRLSADGSRVEAATFLGGTGMEEFTRTRQDGSGRVYVTGNTKSTDWPVTQGALQPTHMGGGRDSILAVLSSDLTALEYSTFIGGSKDDRGRGLWLGSGKVFVTGDTASSDFPTTASALNRALNGATDGYLMNLYLPSSVFSDDFESGNLLSWSMTIP